MLTIKTINKISCNAYATLQKSNFQPTIRVLYRIVAECGSTICTQIAVNPGAHLADICVDSVYALLKHNHPFMLHSRKSS
jgi:hypothetical protein